MELINRLSDAGCRAIEMTSFVSPKWVAQMRDHTQVVQKIKRMEGVCYSALIPNMQVCVSILLLALREASQPKTS